MNEILTVFTPTFNRQELLSRLYKSLCRQTNKNFVWMVIDDGSTDQTEGVVDSWISDNNDFIIEYYKKENGGLQSGYVEAIKHLKTELAMCVDSDDYIVDNAVEIILNKWIEVKNQGFAGIFALDRFENGHILGGKFAEDVSDVDLIALSIGKEKRTEPDRALIVRSDLYKVVKPAKRYPGERTMNATYLHLQIAEKHRFAVLNEPVIVVEYQADGLSKGKKKHYISAPNTYADWRLYRFTLPGASFIFYYRNAIHYVSSCIFAKRHLFVPECKRPFAVFLALIPGILLNVYLRRYK